MSAAFPLQPLRPVYTLAGDESYFRDRFRAALRDQLAPETLEFGWRDEDLAATPLDAVLDWALNPSLMAPQQVFWVRNARELYGRGTATAADTGSEEAPAAGKKKHGAFPDNLRRFTEHAGEPPAAVVVFVADHIHIAADRARMGLDDKSRLQRIEATLGAVGPVIACAQATEAQAAALAQQMALDLGSSLSAPQARRLAEVLDGQLALLQREIEKLALHASGGAITDAAIAALVTGAASASAFELAECIARGDRAGALGRLRAWLASEGESEAIGLIFQLSRAFSMALLAREARVSDRSRLYQVLPEGLRPPGFAADSILAIARRMPEARLRQLLPALQEADMALRSSPPSVGLVLERALRVSGRD
ncbi:MAG TPA: DNA polymerase III subunit delta [Terriglobales bacterium]|nr:DNA polymerase III subunit delta [Terriglobales bacterium]